MNHTNDTLEEIAKRFWETVDIRDTNECWPWKGGQQGMGYGCFKFRGQNTTASRVALILTIGDLPPDKNECCHHCDNPICCNPAHLFPGNRFDNMRDAAVKGRVKNGEKHWNSKLTSEQVIEIRRIYIEEKKSYARIASLFGMTYGAIQNVLNGRGWKRATGGVSVSRPIRKLTKEIAELARTMFSTGSVSVNELAEKFGVGPDCIYHVIKGKTWSESRGPVKPVLSRHGGRTKVTKEEVIEIRNRFEGGESQGALAVAFHIHQSQVSRIIARKRWAHI